MDFSSVEIPGYSGDPSWGQGDSLFALAVLGLMALLAIRGHPERRPHRRASPGGFLRPIEGPPSPAPPPPALPHEDVDRLDAGEPVAVFLVGGENELGPLALRVFKDSYRDKFHQVLFASVGVFDFSILDAGVDRSRGFEGTEEARRLRQRTRQELDPYIRAAHEVGLRADCRVAIGTSPVEEIASLASQVLGVYPHSVFFVGKLVFEKSHWFHRLLYGRRSDAIRRRLESRGVPVTVIPVVVRG